MVFIVLLASSLALTPSLHHRPLLTRASCLVPRAAVVNQLADEEVKRIFKARAPAPMRLKRTLDLHLCAEF